MSAFVMSSFLGQTAAALGIPGSHPRLLSKAFPDKMRELASSS
jgi:hypothetical protein